MATSIDDNAADENLYKLFGEMSVIQYTRQVHYFVSGGERQKLVVARALLKDAPVMLFDEASSGFDVEANEYLYKIITEEMPEKSVIFITHHYDKLEKFDKVYLVKDGFLTEVRTGKM